MTSELEFSVIGISYKTSDVALREKYQITRKEIEHHLLDLFSFSAISGVVILSTCNRIEFYLLHQPNVNLIALLDSHFKKMKGIGFPPKENYYHINEFKAIEHLFKVISGLDSMVLGEFQIQGQVKEAYSHACSARSVEKTIHKIFHSAFRTGKSIRTNTKIGSGRHSTAGVASEILMRYLNTEDTITIIGVNENSKIIADNLKSKGFDKFIFLNRTVSKAHELAEKFGGKALGLESVEKSLRHSRAVFTSTGAEEFIVTHDMVDRLVESGRCPKIMIDMAVPRDIDTSNINSDVKVITINELKNFLEYQNNQQKDELPKAYKIIENEVNLIKEWSENHNEDFIGEYIEKFEITRQTLINEMLAQFSESDKEMAEKLSKMLVHRLQATFVSIIKSKECNSQKNCTAKTRRVTSNQS